MVVKGLGLSPTHKIQETTEGLRSGNTREEGGRRGRLLDCRVCLVNVAQDGFEEVGRLDGKYYGRPRNDWW